MPIGSLSKTGTPYEIISPDIRSNSDHDKEERIQG